MGIDVTILEQDANSERSSHNAGIQVSDNVNELLRLHDGTGKNMTVLATSNQWSIFPRQNVFVGAGLRYWTNWGLLYRVLRANFDGYQSKACPDVPDARARDGNAVYLTGMRVTGLQYKEGHVTVHYVDQAGNEESITTELVIGADGSRSTVRRLVNAPSAEVEHYTGYFAWRGAVPRKMVSNETADYFDKSVSLELMGKKTYILWYVVIFTKAFVLTKCHRSVAWMTDTKLNIVTSSPPTTGASILMSWCSIGLFTKISRRAHPRKWP